MKKKTIIIAVVCAVVLCVIVDYSRVYSFEKSIFCVATELVDKTRSFVRD